MKSAVVESDNRFITRAVRICLPLVDLMAEGRMSWADREKFSAAIAETIHEAKSMDAEIAMLHGHDNCGGASAKEAPHE